MNHPVVPSRPRRPLRFAAIFRGGVAMIAGLCFASGPSGFGQDLGTNLWTVPLGHFSLSSPALDTNGVIYIGTGQGRLDAVNPDGTVRWTYRGSLEMCATPAVAPDGTIYIGSRDRQLHAVDADGKGKWTFQTGWWVDSSAALGEDGTIYFGSWDRKFYALTPDGARQWEFPTDGPIVSSPAIDTNGVIYFGSHDKKFYALNPDGSKRWEFPTDGPILSSPAIDATGGLIFTSTDGKLYSLNPDGTRRWALRTGGITGASPVVSVDGAIQLGVNHLHTRVTPDGQVQWQGSMDPRGHPPFDWLESTPAILADGSILVAGTDLRLRALKPDGQGIRDYSLLGAIHASPVVGPDGTIYCLNRGGLMFAMQNSTPLAGSSWPMFRANPQRTGRVNRQ